MTSVNRRPLVPRALSLQIPTVLSPLKRTASGASKRPRSPDPIAESNSKRVKGGPLSPGTLAAREDDRKEKERKRVERDAQKEEFRIKYTKAFPGWVFYFDLDLLDPDSASVREYLESKVIQLGGRVEDFFSNEVSHVVTNSAAPGEDPTSNKENAPKHRLIQPKTSSLSMPKPSSLLKSPIKLKTRPQEDHDALVKKALGWGKKVWSTAKLESVLERLLVSGNSATAATTPPKAGTSQQRRLTHLLESERIHGTSERDPTQKRHDFRYFSRSSCFILVEDMKQELATIHALEYPISKGRDGVERAAWPVLHCHPQARGPFIEFDEKEKKRWEKSLKAEDEKEREQEQKVRRRQDDLKRKAQAQRKAGDLRRSVSMNNLHRRASLPNAGCEALVDLDADASGCDGTTDSANASGYLASAGTGGYMAASGNSVGITSTTGTTSTAGASLRNMKLPAALQERIQSQVVTSRKFPSALAGVTANSEKGKGSSTKGSMGPPVGIPERPNGMLRKSRSTNTLRLPKREEGCKPGYCESCRVKFEDFKSHVQGKKHRKFAMDENNFLSLDFLLTRVRRRTIEDVEQERHEWGTRNFSSGNSDSGLDCDAYSFLSPSPQDMDQTIRPWDDAEVDADGDAIVE